MRATAMKAVLGTAGICVGTVVLFVDVPVFGSVIYTLGNTAPTYEYTLTFDEPGGPVGHFPEDAFAASHGVTWLSSFGSSDFCLIDDPANCGYPWAGGDNALISGEGVGIWFDADLTAFSAQVWHGPDDNPVGQMWVFLLHNGEDFGYWEFDPAWGGIGDEWLNITTTGGIVFNAVMFYDFNGDPSLPTIVDNLSWVPEPASLLPLALGSLAVMRKRRRTAPR